MVTTIFLNQKRVNVCEHMTKMTSLESFLKVPPGGWEKNCFSSKYVLSFTRTKHRSKRQVTLPCQEVEEYVGLDMFYVRKYQPHLPSHEQTPRGRRPWPCWKDQLDNDLHTIQGYHRDAGDKSRWKVVLIYSLHYARTCSTYLNCCCFVHLDLAL